MNGPRVLPHSDEAAHDHKVSRVKLQREAGKVGVKDEGEVVMSDESKYSDAR